MGNVAGVAPFLGGPVKLFIGHPVRHGLVTVEAEGPFLRLQKPIEARCVGVVAHPADPVPDRSVMVFVLGLFLRSFMALEAETVGIVFQAEHVGGTVWLVAILTIPIAENCMRDRLRLFGLEPILVALNACLARGPGCGGDDPGQEKAR